MAVAAVGALGLLALAAPGSDAAFKTGSCGGTDITGSGATFQTGAHTKLWATTALANYCGGVTPPIVTWNVSGTTGSGYGRRVMGDRSGDNQDGNKSRTGYAERFGGSDEPPTATAVANMNKGSDAIGDEGVVHTIPVSLGAIAILVNLPVGCTNIYDGANVSDPTEDERKRIQLTGAQVERAFRGEAVWADLVPSIQPAACRTLAVKRVVRSDDSGSTYALKDYLRTQGDPGFGWLTTYISNPNTTNWPNPGTLVKSAGGPAVVTTASTTDGSISYAELDTARVNASKAFERQADVNDDTYWVQVGPVGSFRDPARHPDGFLANTLEDKKGANCEGAPISGVPGGDDPTLGLWTDTTAVNGAGAYAICTLTYGLAFDDNAAAYGNTDDEEVKARTVNDY
ncbi:MAG TPA: substrate-binding domain-containing protein, partial [Solirubrobacteraceae bacterium]|nr:substrate-binding domain-containing protein [Solirubrobacteraceae bacterium]